MNGIDKGKPEYGKQYALTGGSKDKCIMNGNTWAESEVGLVPTLNEVKCSKFGCRNCLYASIECKEYSNFKPEYTKDMYGKKVATCKGYTYYD